MDIYELVETLKRLEIEENKIKSEIRKFRGSIISKYVKCGKERCKICKFGKGHGPYYYLVRYENGKQKWKYIGRNSEKFDNFKKLNVKLRDLRNQRREILVQLKKAIDNVLANL